ncbi:MAG: energy transducer TonB [Spirochaetia bacterium]|nr:energy transducer TonB [Spirochaetia bacterium]
MKPSMTLTLTMLVTSIAVAGLFLPITIPQQEPQQTSKATSATISLIDSPASQASQQQTPPAEQAPPAEQTPPAEQAPPAEQTPPASEKSFSSLASVAASAVSDIPDLSLVDGYYELSSVTEGPSFDRDLLTSRLHYPPLAKRQNKEGLVLLRLFISESGTIERILVEEDPGYGLSEAAIAAFTGLIATPATLAGKAVPVTLRYPIRFTLK